MKKHSRKDTPLEKKKWYQNTKALLAVAGGLIATTAGLIAIFQSEIFRPAKVMENVEIVVDGSDAMRKPFEGKTKFEVAANVIDETLREQVADQDNLALRYYGGTCDSNNSQLLVKFAQNNAEKVRTAVRSIKLGGLSTLTSAMINATGDFNDPKRFEGVSKRIIVITGGGDSCVQDPEQFLRSRLKIGSSKEEFSVNFRFIGMDLSPEQQEQLRKLAEETHGVAIPVKSQDELKKALEGVIITEPIKTDIDTTTKILNTVIDNINDALTALQQRDYVRADTSLKKARTEFARTELPFQDFSTRQSKKEFRELYRLASENRDVQKKLLALVDTIISNAKSGNSDANSEALKTYENLSSGYNSNKDKMNDILGSL